MKRLLFLSLLGFVLILAACSDGTVEVDTETPGEVETEDVANSLEEAQVGQTYNDDIIGTYTITKVITPNNTKQTSEPVTFVMDYVKFATFVPEDSDMFDGNEVLSLAIMFVTSENTSEDTVSFHPFSTTLTTDTQQQIDAQMWLNSGESKHIGTVVQKHAVAYTLGDETHEDIGQLTFSFDGTAQDSMTVGEDVTVVVPVE